MEWKPKVRAGKLRGWVNCRECMQLKRRREQGSKVTTQATGQAQSRATTEHSNTKKGYCRMDGKLVAKAGKLIKGLGSGKAGSGSKLRPVRQLATEPQEQAKTRKKKLKHQKKKQFKA